jgi:hypothetical protein
MLCLLYFASITFSENAASAPNKKMLQKLMQYLR